MRKFLAGLLLLVACTVLGFPKAVHAAGENGPQPTYGYQTAVSSGVTNIVSISTSSVGNGLGATQVDASTVTGRVVIEIQNIDSAANLWCVLGSTTPTVNGGRKISAGGSWIVSIASTLYQTLFSTTTGLATNIAYVPLIYCLSDGSAATKAAVTQTY